MSNTIKKVLILAKSLKPIVTWIFIALAPLSIALAMVMSTHDQVVLEVSPAEQGIRVLLFMDNHHSELK